MRATLRWAHSDLRTHRGEALFLVLATAGIVVSLLLAAALFGYATNPWQRIFTQERGAHVWIHTDRSAQVGKLAGLDGVESVAGPYPTAVATLASRGTRASVELRATPPERPGVGRPLLTAGHWLRADAPGGVVLESSLARALLAEPGDTLTLPGTARTVTVVGVAGSAEPHYRVNEQPGLVWVLPSAVPHPTGQVIGLRLTDPGDTDYAVQRAVTVLGAGAIGEVSTWQQARAEAQGDNRLLGQVLGLFGLGALVAAGLAVHGAIATRIRGHLRDISVLKAIGFTPAQVVRVFLFQHIAYALLGAAAAAALTEALGSHFPGRLGEALGVWQGLPGHAPTLFTVPAGAVLFIGATTALAAWRAGRVPPVPVARPAGAGGGGLGLARRALGLVAGPQLPDRALRTPGPPPGGRATDPAPPFPAPQPSATRPTAAGGGRLLDLARRSLRPGARPSDSADRPGSDPRRGEPTPRPLAAGAEELREEARQRPPARPSAPAEHPPRGRAEGTSGTRPAVPATGHPCGSAHYRTGLAPTAPSGGHLSGTARRALGLGVPPALVLGWHTASFRRMRSLATVARLSLPLLLIVVAMSAWTTIDRFHSRPEQIGLPAALTVHTDAGTGDRAARALLQRDPQVADVYPGVEVAALVPGQTATIALRGLGTSQNPYPYTLAEGRPARGSDEAVAGQGLLDLLDVRVGDWVRMTVGDQPQILHIVGRSIEPENAGRVISTSLDTLRDNDPRLAPTLYQLRLRPGADPHTVAGRLAAAGHGRLDVHAVTNPADGLSPLRSVVVGLIAVLALIGLVELLTAIGGTVREGERDLLALKAIGLSPRQITAITVTATGCTALAAVLAGTALGTPLAHWLIDSQGRSSGIGAGIAQSPSPVLLLLFGAAAVLGAAALAALPAARAARRRLADTLSAVA
ncbi:FtsX-like permease family protein [Streptomyces sp. SAI-041]|uniref:ABC transporter permease n=1 Tax=Streptomyces sp. SAI-041 TaxID=2940548 RepID=UPI002474DD97|nr:FtsX-like permease family protein [Streptomyces sp. SAI-041]MDH6552084.1 putative ABC transport system permease protein [Streptomyces sp. SAI-041]